MSENVKIPLRSLSIEELAAWFEAAGERRFRAAQVMQWLYAKRVKTFAAMTDLSASVRQHLETTFTISDLALVRKLGSEDTTQKFLLQLTDGALIESVLIPASRSLYGSRSDRRTICISTQVGCAYGCKFCASGLDGFSRNLQPAEIVEQILRVEELSGEMVNNIVFMGMGEPLANFGNLMKAIEIINAAWGVALGARHITVSTSGLAPQIRALADQPLQIRLAISLHGATDEVRQQIMPVNRRYNLATLLEACAYYRRRKKQRLTFEYILIDSVNDTIEQAEALAVHASRLEAKINLIPYNRVDGLDWKRPDEDRQEAFRRVLTSRGVIATIRREKGHDIDAACGQLRLQAVRAADVATPDKSFAQSENAR